MGHSTPRIEDDRFLLGAGTFVDDVSPTGALHAAFVRSEEAHARIRSVDVSTAMDMDGVVAIYTHEDVTEIGDPLPLRFPHAGLIEPRTQRPLAVDRVLYEGEIVAMVVASDRYVAEDIADAVVIEYEQLPVVVGIDGALAGRGPVHEDVPDNIAANFRQTAGDADTAIANAPHRLSLELMVERSAATPLEPRAVVAFYDQDAQLLTVYDTTQAPTVVRFALAERLGLDPSGVHVIAPDVGGAFGVKLPTFYPEEFLVPFAALSLMRPVRWTEDRREHFIGSNHERGQWHRVDVGFDDAGRVVGFRDRFVHDTGAYCPYGVIVPFLTSARMIGPYRIEHYRCDVAVVYTNTVPITPYRGAGQPQAAFVIERTMDSIARTLQLDRATVRRANFVYPRDLPYRTGLLDEDGTEIVYDYGEHEKCLDRVLEIIGYRNFAIERAVARARGRVLGLGIGSYIQGTGMGPGEGANVVVQPTGIVRVTVGIGTQGQGHETTLAQIAAGRLGIPVKQVTVQTGDTFGFTSDSAGTFASRSAVVVGNAVAAAADALCAMALEIAAEEFGVRTNELEFKGGVVRKRADSDATLSLGDIAVLAHVAGATGAQASGVTSGLQATRVHSPPRPTFSGGAHAAVIEVDPEVATVRVLRYAAVHDGGTLVNPAVVEGQLHGGIVQGIGGALYERLIYDKGSGELLNANLNDFLVPFVSEVPVIKVAHLETVSTSNSLGIRGVGEAGTILPAAVVTAAIEDALGLPIHEAPVSQQRLYEILNE